MFVIYLFSIKCQVLVNIAFGESHLSAHKSDQKELSHTILANPPRPSLDREGVLSLP